MSRNAVPGLFHHPPQFNPAFLDTPAISLGFSLRALPLQVPFTKDGDGLTQTNDLCGCGITVEIEGITDQAVLDLQHQHRILERPGLGGTAYGHLPAFLGGLYIGIVG